tara:strand:- start:369 stop:1019 length:651 start_codon:yes stop_codon:yes gene_type:complete
MGLFDFIRPTPGKLISQALPLYLEETERPISNQAILLGSLSFGLTLTNDKPLITIVSARAITSGCILAAHTTANHLSPKRFDVSESEYADFRNNMLSITVGSIDNSKDAKIKADKEKYIQIAQDIEMKVTALTADNVWKHWDSIQSEEWKNGISALYRDALKHLGNNDSRLSEDEKNAQQIGIESFCTNVGESHWGIFQTVQKEISDLMKAKNVAI